MGLFSSKYETTVGTVVSRVIKDDAIPESAVVGLTKALLSDDPNGDVADYVMEELIGSIGMKAERLYDYAKTKYTHGLPSGEYRRATQGLAEVQQVLDTLEGQPVLIEYYRFGSPNNLHMGWMKLLSLHGYNPVTNTITDPIPGVVKNSLVYLADMVVVIPADKVGVIKPGELEQWGPPAKSGYTPASPANTGPSGVKYSHSPFHVDATAAEEYVRVDYVYVVNEPGEYGSVVPVNKTGSLNIPMGAVDDTADYFHVKYTVADGQPKYWQYQSDTGVYPVLDDVFNVVLAQDVAGSYFPFAYFRFNKTDQTTDTTTEDYKTTRKMLKYLGMDYDTVAEGINENPDIADVEQAMLVFAVPANTTHPLEQQYLFTYFNTLFMESGSQFNSPIRERLAHDFMGTLNNQITKSSIVIQDKRFKMALSNNGIYKKRIVGSIGPKGSYASGTSNVTINTDWVQFSGGQDGVEVPVVIPSIIKEHYYRHQVTEHLYDEIRVSALRMTYHVYGEYTTTGDELDDILLIPLDHSITEDYSMGDREILYSRALHLVFNSRTVTEIKWYQQEWFEFFMYVVAAVVIVMSFGSATGPVAALTSAIAAGSSAAISAAIMALLVQVLQGIVISLVLKIFVKVVGVKLAFLIAIIAVFAGAMGAFNAGSIAGAPWAQELLSLANGLTKAIQANLQDMFKDLVNEANEFTLLMKEQTKTIDDANKLLENDNWLTPTIIWGEKPNDFYNRTIHSGNIGVMSIGAISSFVDTALTLPKIDETLDWNANV